MLRRRTIGSKKLVFFQKRFYPAGNYTWTVPAGCMEVDVFLVGGGCGGNRGYSDTGGAGGYTKTFKKIHPDGEMVMLFLLYRVSQFQ